VYFQQRVIARLALVASQPIQDARQIALVGVVFENLLALAHSQAVDI